MKRESQKEQAMELIKEGKALANDMQEGQDGSAKRSKAMSLVKKLNSQKKEVSEPQRQGIRVGLNELKGVMKDE